MATVLMQQIHLSGHEPGFELVPVSGRGNNHYKREHDEQEAYLLSKCAAELWHHGSYTALCPRPILVSQDHLQRVQALHEALTTAVVDIVQRWWTDKEAQFPERMPLEREEEELLQWLQTQPEVTPFSERLGSWRPDFLVHDCYDDDDGSALVENFNITEINARFCFNGFMHEHYGQMALDETLSDHSGDLCSATDAQSVLHGLFDLFRPDLPLHLLKDEEAGIDIHMFIDAVEKKTGVRPRVISPQHLRLVQDASSSTGYTLCCVTTPGTSSVALAPHGPPTTIPASPSAAAATTTTITNSAGELLEPVFQVGLELHQRELAAMDPALLREVSLRCCNDMRTILLVHDKRMLGIIKQELPRLVARAALTPAQAQVLQRGIVDTYLPGSPELHRLAEACRRDPSLRYGYILKPIRGGKGAGIQFGDDLDQHDWVDRLEGLARSASLVVHRRGKRLPAASAATSTNDPTAAAAGQGPCVVQRRIIPRLYDMVLKATGEVTRYPLVGTYHVTNGQLLGLGTWRTSGSRIVAISGGGSAICSVVRSSSSSSSCSNNSSA